MADFGARSGRSDVIDYPFPLRPQLVVKLRLPVDLTEVEAERLAAYIHALAVQSTEDRIQRLEEAELKD